MARRWIHRFSALVAGLALAAATPCCARMAPRRDQSGSVESVVFALRWLLRLMPEIVEYRDRANPFQGGSPEVDPAGRRVFVGLADDNVYCIDAVSGRTVWRRGVGAAVRSRPLFMADTQTLFVGTDDGRLLALGANDGAERWRYNAEAEIQHQPVLDGEALYVAAADNSVHAVDWTTGASLWSYHRDPSEAEFEVSGFAGVRVSERVVFTGFSDGTAVALDSNDGTELWTADLAQDIDQPTRRSGIPVMPDVDTTPVVGRRRVYVASYDAGLYALDRISGDVLWRQPLTGVVAIAGAGDSLYVSRAGHGVAAVATATGRVLWERELGPSTFTEPVLREDLVIVGDNRHGLAALRRTDGTIVQRFPVGSGVGGPPVILGRAAFVLSNGGLLAALSFE